MKPLSGVWTVFRWTAPPPAWSTVVMSLHWVIAQAAKTIGAGRTREIVYGALSYMCVQRGPAR